MREKELTQYIISEATLTEDHKKICGDVLEAIVGALYLDQGT